MAGEEISAVASNSVLPNKTASELKTAIRGIKISITKRSTSIKNNLSGEVPSELLVEYKNELLCKIRTTTKLYLDYVQLVSVDELESVAADQEEYLSNLESLLEIVIGKLKSSVSVDNSNGSPESLPPKRAYLPFKLPELSVPTFESNSDNCITFYRFSQSFNNAVNSCTQLTNPQKLAFLKSRLIGQALNLVGNLTSFEEAWQLLKLTYQNNPAIVNQICSELLLLVPVRTVEEITCMLANIRFRLSELGELSSCLPRTGERSPGDAILDYLVRSKLPNYFLNEVSRRVSNSYPSVNQIFDHSAEVCNMFSQSSVSNVKPKIEKNDKMIKFNPKSVAPKTDSFTVRSTATNQSNSTPESGIRSVKNCKFCAGVHTTFHCPKYTSHATREKQASVTNLCNRCLSSRHSGENCRSLPFSCSLCRSFSHVSPLCPKYKPQ